VLVDADPARSAALLAVNGNGACTWPNVSFVVGPDEIHRDHDCDVVVVDSPSLTEKASRTVLARADGIILTCLADPMSIRTVPAVASVIESVRLQNNNLELLGILIGLYNELDVVQKAMMNRLQQNHRDLLLEPSVPFQVEYRSWPLQPGSEPPPGAARDAFTHLVSTLDRWLAAA
jgi:cellulose biosynthesis protein BcsQ